MSKRNNPQGKATKGANNKKDRDTEGDDISSLLAAFAQSTRYPSGKVSEVGLSHDWAHPSVVIATGSRGRGLFVKEDVPAGTLLLVSHSAGLAPLTSNPNVALGMDVLASTLYDSKLVGSLGLNPDRRARLEAARKGGDIAATAEGKSSAPSLSECFPILPSDLYPSSAQVAELQLPNPLLADALNANGEVTRTSVKLTLPTWLSQKDTSAFLKKISDQAGQTQLKQAIHVAQFNSILVSPDAVSSLPDAIDQGAFNAPMNLPENALQLFPAYCLFPAMALINHSCVPNVSPRFHYLNARSVSRLAPGVRQTLEQRPRAVATITALTGLRAGDELAFNYIPLVGTDGSASVPWISTVRRANLESHYRFICKCPRCTFQPPLHSLAPGQADSKALKLKYSNPASEVAETFKSLSKTLAFIRSSASTPEEHRHVSWSTIEFLEVLLQGIRESATTLHLSKVEAVESKPKLEISLPKPEEILSRGSEKISAIFQNPIAGFALKCNADVRATLSSSNWASVDDQWKASREALFESIRVLAENGVSLSRIHDCINKCFQLLIKGINPALEDDPESCSVLSIATPSEIRRAILMGLKSCHESTEIPASTDAVREFVLMLPKSRSESDSCMKSSSSLMPLYVERTKLCFASVTEVDAESASKPAQEIKVDNSDNELGLTSVPIQMCPAVELCLVGYDKTRSLLLALPGMAEREGALTADPTSETWTTSHLAIALLDKISAILNGSVGALHWTRFLVHSGLGVAYTYANYHVEALRSRIMAYVIASLTLPDNHFSLIPLLDAVLDSLLEVLRSM